MGATGQRLKLRLFIEGVEVPVIAAQVQVTPNSPAVASIQVPPLPEGTRLHPRSVIHLFFLDFYEVQSPLLSDTTAAVTSITDGTVTPTTYERSAMRAVENNNGKITHNQDTIDQQVVPDYTNERYKLLFGGELVGFQWTKQATNRSLVLQCTDWSNYWDYAYQWNNTDIFGPGIKAMFSGGGTNLFTDFLEDEGSVIARIIQTPSANYPALKGLLGGIVHLLEAIGGSYYGDKKFGGMNMFFSLAELRLHITQMITAYDKDDTASKLLNASGWDSLFGRIIGGLGQQVSIRQAINALMGVIFHETYSIPSPLYVPSKNGSISGYARSTLESDPSTKFIYSAATEAADVITGVRSAVGDPEDPISAAEEAVSKIKGVQKNLKGVIGRAAKTPAKQVSSLLSTAITNMGKASTLLATKRAIGSPKQADIYKFLTEAISALVKAFSFEFPVTKKGQAIPARLNQQIFRPDIWFSSPPRCNVLFPENYSSISYQRSFLQEPTRLLLKTNDAFFGEDELFDQFYFAPKSLTSIGEKNSVWATLKTDLLNHEVFTGILPVFEKMSELNIFAVRSGTVDGNQAKIGLAQRSCNFLYFKYRFAARQMQVSGKFNPYLVPGFPGLVIDKYVDKERLRQYIDLVSASGRPTPDANKLLGTHFLGNFTEVTHVIDQSSGSTQINCGYPRQVEESVEYLGAVQDEVTVRQKSPKLATRITVVASTNPPMVSSLGPNFGEIISVDDVTFSKKGQEAPLYRGSRNKKGAPSFMVMVGQPGLASDFGEEVVTQVGDPNLLIEFKAYRVVETVSQYKLGKVLLTPEEMIRPGWYSDVWSATNIGQAYQQFFAIGSINDPTQAHGFGGASIGVRDEASQIAEADEANTASADDPTGDQQKVFTLVKGASIQEAVNYLVSVYSFIKQQELDTDEFIRAYTWRPIASMVDLFGTSDLLMTYGTDGTPSVIQGIEGFHSRAFGSRSDLFGLVTPDIQDILGIKRGSTISQKVDKRKEKQDAVKDYVAALSFSRAILG